MWSYFLSLEINSCHQLSRHFPGEPGLESLTGTRRVSGAYHGTVRENVLLFRVPWLVWLQLPSKPFQIGKLKWRHQFNTDSIWQKAAFQKIRNI